MLCVAVGSSCQQEVEQIGPLDGPRKSDWNDMENTLQSIWQNMSVKSFQLRSHDLVTSHTLGES